jgi:fumarate hydratase class II
MQKIGYDNAAAVAKKAHKEGTTLKVTFALFISVVYLCSFRLSFRVMCPVYTA